MRTCEDGTELCFYKLTNKFVPADYELTEEDKKAQEDGNFNLAYGSDKVEVMTSYTVEWNWTDRATASSSLVRISALRRCLEWRKRLLRDRVSRR